ncbi:MAG TPA: hypothetical protein PK718_02625 [Candidatus Methanofastidiosa archaeon]|nr:hypothetical protein [Candidatus Methanofastidiosa archaeon]HPR41425.1 hypothetical protein [Candidatus Methanofastidiosa archaeon]
MNTEIRRKSIYSAGVGGVYLSFGLVQFVFSLGVGTSSLRYLNIDDNIFGGFIMALIGVVFIFALERMRRDDVEGTAFQFSGIFLSLLFAGINLLILGADLLSAALEGGSLELLGSITPIIYLGVLSLAGLMLWKDEFSLNRLSRAGA